MPVVSDTSPILGLSAIGYLGLLQDQFEEVFIPLSVLAELKVGTDFRGTDAIQQALSDGWLKSKEIQNEPLARSLSLELHKGEAEAITLAMDLGMDMIVMDERIGREHAKALGLKTVGILGVLLSAKKHGKIDSVGNAMKSLRREVGFFISERLYEGILKQADELE
jgi:predicted nucleic acid-binding protein